MPTRKPRKKNPDGGRPSPQEAEDKRDVAIAKASRRGKGDWTLDDAWAEIRRLEAE